jgi:hypothetical protein
MWIGAWLAGRSHVQAAICKYCGVTEELSVPQGRPAHIIQQLVPFLPAPASASANHHADRRGHRFRCSTLDRRAEATSADEMTR